MFQLVPVKLRISKLDTKQRWLYSCRHTLNAIMRIQFSSVSAPSLPVDGAVLLCNFSTTDSGRSRTRSTADVDHFCTGYSVMCDSKLYANTVACTMWNDCKICANP